MGNNIDDRQIMALEDARDFVIERMKLLERRIKSNNEGIKKFLEVSPPIDKINMLVALLRVDTETCKAAKNRWEDFHRNIFND